MASTKYSNEKAIIKYISGALISINNILSNEEQITEVLNA
jgi:hypothetical protein